MPNMPPPPKQYPPLVWVTRTPDTLKDSSRWVTIYPNYIDSKKTLEEGRRIPKSAACEFVPNDTERH